MKLYDKESETWKLLGSEGIAGYCGGDRWYLTTCTFRTYLLAYNERDKPPEEVAQVRIKDMLNHVLTGCKLRKFDSISDLQCILQEIASEEQRQQLYDHHNNQCNVRIGDTLYLGGAARNCTRGKAIVPPTRHYTMLRNRSDGYFYRDPEWWPTTVGSCCNNIAHMFHSRSDFSTKALKQLIASDTLVQCLAQHGTRGVRGRFNMDLYKMLPENTKDDDGLVRQWYNLADDLYTCMPLPLFGNPLHGGGFSWASFFYRTDNPETLPTITTGTAKELLE